MLGKSVISIYKDRCRLCLDDNGVNILQMKNKDTMLELLSLTSGLAVADIHRSSQKICEQCCIFALKLCSYRKMVAENDRLLKEIFNELQHEEQAETSSCSNTFLRSEFSEKDVTQYTTTSEVSSVPQSKTAETSEVPTQESLRQEKKLIEKRNNNKMITSVSDAPVGFHNISEKSKQDCSNVDKHNQAVAIVKADIQNLSQEQNIAVEPSPQNNLLNVTLPNLKRKCENPQDAKCLTRNKRKLKNRDVLQKAELVNIDNIDSDVHKYMLTSSLELVSTTNAFSKVNLCKTNNENGIENSEDLLLSHSGKSVDVFTCSMCEKMFDSQRKRLNHQKRHLRCKLCKKHWNTWEEYTLHVKTSCKINLTRNSPCVKLKRIDKDKELIRQYPQAFKVLGITVPLPNEILSALHNIKEEELIILDDTTGNGSEKRSVTHSNNDTQSLFLDKRLSNSTDIRMERPSAVIEPNEDVQNSAIMEKDLHRQMCATSKETNVETKAVLKPSENAQSDSILEKFIRNSLKKQSSSNSELILNGISSYVVADLRHKDEVIQMLFNKYKGKQNTSNTNSETVSLSRFNIIHTSLNSITYQNLYEHLMNYKIPVSFTRSKTLFSRYYMKDDHVQSEIQFDWSSLKCNHFVKPSHNVIDNKNATVKVGDTSLVVSVPLKTNDNSKTNQLEQSNVSLVTSECSNEVLKPYSLENSGACTSRFVVETVNNESSSTSYGNSSVTTPIKGSVNIYNTVIHL